MVRTASGDLCPPAACQRTCRPKRPKEAVSALLLSSFSFLFRLSKRFYPRSARCRVPAALRNANLAERYVTRKSFASGDRVQYVCDVGYAQAGGSRYRKCADGRWSPLHLRCERTEL